MKQFLKTILRNYLRWCATRRLHHWTPVVIAITGSVGKTTTKDALAHILSGHFRVAKTEGNYNTDIGLPLAILNVKSGGSLWSWMYTLGHCLVNSFSSGTQDYFIAEMGADKPGDIRYLVSFLKPHMSIVTNIAKVHVANGQFHDERDIQKEKSEIVRCLTESDVALLHADNEYVREMSSMTKARVILFGKSQASDAQVSSIKVQAQGVSFCLEFEGVRHSFQVPLMGEFLVSAVIPGVVIALMKGVSQKDIQKKLDSFILPKGRFNFIPGIHGTALLDSSYNASPYAVREALQAFSSIPGKRKILVLGSMNELGASSESEHRSLGAIAAQRCDILVTVGFDAHWIADEAGKVHPQLPIHHYGHYQPASVFLHETLQEGDLVLFKGSQNGVFLEEAVKSVMLHREDASRVLVRQESEWQEKKEYREKVEL